MHLRRVEKNANLSDNDIRGVRRTVDSLAILLTQHLQTAALARATDVQASQQPGQPPQSTQTPPTQQPLLIPYLALTGLMDHVVSSIEQLIVLLQDRIDRRQSYYRTRAVQIIAGLSAALTIISGSAAFFSIPITILQPIVAIGIVVALVTVLILVSLDFSNRTRFSSIRDAFAEISFATSVPIYAFRSRIAETGSVTQQSITETHEFFILLDTAIRYRFLQLASDYLDDATKKVFKAEVDYLADPNTTYWLVLTTDLGRKLLNSNDTVKDLIGRLQAYSVELAANQRVQS